MTDAAPSTPEERISALGPSLPPAPPRVGLFTPAVRYGDLLFVSGHASRDAGRWITGIFGADLGVEEGAGIARLTALSCLATIKAEIGELSRVRRLLKILGMLRTTPAFGGHPQVLDGCTALLIEVFGPSGGHARSAVGMSSLPFGAALEIEMIVAVSDAPPPAVGG